MHPFRETGPADKGKMLVPLQEPFYMSCFLLKAEVNISICFLFLPFAFAEKDVIRIQIQSNYVYLIVIFPFCHIRDLPPLSAYRSEPESIGLRNLKDDRERE